VRHPRFVHATLETQGSGATAALGLRRTAGTTTAAAVHLGQIIEYEACRTIFTIDEINFNTAQMLQCRIVNDDIKTLARKHHIIAIDLIGKCHTETYTAATTGRCVYTDSLNIFLNLLNELSHLALRRARKAEITGGKEVHRGLAHNQYTPKKLKFCCILYQWQENINTPNLRGD